MGSPSVSPTSTLVDFSDSHYQHVKQRILAINSTRLFGGIVEARDWPLKETLPNAFYMLTNLLDPVKTAVPGENSWSAPTYGMRIQWAWTIIGTDIPAGALASNRGDRYRVNFQMVQEMLHGFFPGFCEKCQYSLNGTELVATSYMPKEMVWFTMPQVTDRIDTSTGVLFGAASTMLTGFTPTILG